MIGIEKFSYFWQTEVVRNFPQVTDVSAFNSVEAIDFLSQNGEVS